MSKWVYEGFYVGVQQPYNPCLQVKLPNLNRENTLSSLSESLILSCSTEQIQRSLEFDICTTSFTYMKYEVKPDVLPICIPKGIRSVHDLKTNFKTR